MSNDPIDNATQVYEELVALLAKEAPSAKLFSHQPSKSSEESMEARHSASGERVTGAKALLIKMSIKDKPNVFAVIVLPGLRKLDSKAMKKKLKEHDRIGFNAADFEKSIIMNTKDYLKMVTSDGIFPCSVV